MPSLSGGCFRGRCRCPARPGSRCRTGAAFTASFAARGSPSRCCGRSARRRISKGCNTVGSATSVPGLDGEARRGDAPGAHRRGAGENNASSRCSPMPNTRSRSARSASAPRPGIQPSEPSWGTRARATRRTRHQRALLHRRNRNEVMRCAEQCHQRRPPYTCTAVPGSRFPHPPAPRNRPPEPLTATTHLAPGLRHNTRPDIAPVNDQSHQIIQSRHHQLPRGGRRGRPAPPAP